MIDKAAPSTRPAGKNDGTQRWESLVFGHWETADRFIIHRTSIWNAEIGEMAEDLIAASDLTPTTPPLFGALFARCRCGGLCDPGGRQISNGNNSYWVHLASEANGINSFHRSTGEKCGLSPRFSMNPLASRRFQWDAEQAYF